MSEFDLKLDAATPASAKILLFREEPIEPDYVAVANCLLIADANCPLIPLRSVGIGACAEFQNQLGIPKFREQKIPMFS